MVADRPNLNKKLDGKTIAKWMTEPRGWVTGKLSNPKPVEKATSETIEKKVTGWTFTFTESGAARDRAVMTDLRLRKAEYGASGTATWALLRRKRDS